MYNTQNHHVHAAGCSSLGHLAVTGLDLQVVEEGGVASVTRAMGLHTKNLLLQRAACRSLYSMAVAGGGHCLNEISRQDVARIVAITRKYHADPIVCWANTRLVALLAEGASLWRDELRDQVGDATLLIKGHSFTHYSL
eukprot:FR740920.1.p1 GENE.FR740920.1~~FR740920.1.p1  ORF type:complete len:139 (-),score=6.54 FR740920.1:164-580(-)